MFKSIVALAVLGFASTVQSHEIQAMAPMNYVSQHTPQALYNGLLEAVQGHRLQDSNVVFTQCDADVKGNFILDPSQTKAVPNPVTKGITVALNLGGLMTAQTEVTNVNINVLWNNTPLHKEDHSQDTKVAANSPFTYNLSWQVPAFAPSGHYHVIITIQGKAGTSTTVQSVGCANADFDL